MFTPFDEKMMRLALDEARLAKSAGDIAVGAVIVRGDEIICAARNTREADGDPTGHAEINCIRKAARILGSWRLTGCAMYVTLEPCCMCAGAIAQARLDRVVFGAFDEKAGCCASLYRITEDPDIGLYVPADGGLLKEECAAILKSSISQ